VQPDQPQRHRDEAKRHDGAKGDEGGAARGWIRRSQRYRVDQMAREQRHEQVGDGRA